MSSNFAGPTRRILGAWPLDQKLVNSQLSMGTAATRVSTGYPLRVSADGLKGATSSQAPLVAPLVWEGACSNQRFPSHGCDVAAHLQYLC